MRRIVKACYRCGSTSHLAAMCPSSTASLDVDGGASSQPLCYFCNNPGHFERSCPMKLGATGPLGLVMPPKESLQQQTQQQLPVCFNCGLPGHIAAGCRQHSGGLSGRYAVSGGSPFRSGSRFMAMPATGGSVMASLPPPPPPPPPSQMMYYMGGQMGGGGGMGMGMPGVCYACGGRGHFARDCKTPSCYSCGGAGHLARNCPSNPSASSSASSSSGSYSSSSNAASKREGGGDVDESVSSRLSAPLGSSSSSSMSMGNMGNCYNCRQPGHMARDCPKRDIVCHRCEQLGHVMKDCPQTTQQTSNSDS
ncbi:hypothetical protein Pelo_239 [Pelomyxa schiedti]|nr:hypothetical protein Pelo_239 [Pelomyxa schiedti]